ncbi:MAG TPA: hypothetical protein VFR15_06705 [Chloroflexia bacterium]|nr:hypothetical protein [Chloroflexia bacterium]
MDGTERLHRRYTILLLGSLLLLAGAVVMFFRIGSGLTRWLVLLGSASNALVWWELRRALPRASKADGPATRAT